MDTGNTSDLAATAASNDDAEAALRNRLMRKRTKTGCLTCRKRRIKCDEERPICRNCIKSKRQCEGYNPRVVFRPQTVDFQHLQNGAASITFPASTMGMDFAFASPGIPIAIAPYSGADHFRPTPLISTNPAQYPVYGIPFSAPPYPQGWQPVQHDGMHFAQQAQYQGPGPIHYGVQHIPSFQSGPQATFIAADPHRRQSVPDARPIAIMPATRGVMDPIQPTSATAPDLQWQQVQTAIDHADRHVSPNPIPTAALSSSGLSTSTWPSEQSSGLPPTPSTDLPIQNTWAHQVGIDNGRAHHETSDVSHVSPQAPWVLEDGLPNDVIYAVTTHDPSLSAVLDAAAIEIHDDDYYDVDEQTEPDAFMPKSSPPPSIGQATLDRVLELGRSQIARLRSGLPDYADGILDAYRPEHVANPLRNPATARVFAHFVEVTAITISTHCRNPLSSTSPERQSIPFSQRGLWIHSVPLAALQDQGLLQAVLALSSLHIAKLTRASSTPSYKHYAYALKRVHQSVMNPQRRKSLPVLAASLLLGRYELWCAEHVKWNSHIAGAAQLLIETDFTSTQRRIEALKAEKAVERQKGFPIFRKAQALGNAPDHVKRKLRQYRDLEQIHDIDAQVVSILSGKMVNYREHGQIVDQDGETRPQDSFLDIPSIEVQKDLFWAYLKQDLIAAVISANPLMMPYSRWTDCPPRAPINLPGTTHGAHDHLILLLGRITDFMVRDRKRKLRVIGRQGGRWKPAAWMQLGPPPGASKTPPVATPRSDSGKTPSPQMPPYFGMAPPPLNSGMPSQYYAEGADGPPLATPDHDLTSDLTEATDKALTEWSEMMAALHMYESLLGEEFQEGPAPTEDSPMTPFGYAKHYLNFDVACLRSYIHFGYILTHRVHPDMPPHAHAAAAIAAKQTRLHVEEIARITAGVLPPDDGRPIAATTAAAMCDSCLGLFFAGVQVVDPTERDWFVNALFEIERRCAYDTAGVIAHGCQTAWFKAGQAGRGPKYQLRFNTRAQDDRINGNWIRIDPAEEVEREDGTNRKFVPTKPAARLFWATGVLGDEGDG